LDNLFSNQKIWKCKAVAAITVKLERNSSVNVPAQFQFSNLLLQVEVAHISTVKLYPDSLGLLFLTMHLDLEKFRHFMHDNLEINQYHLNANKEPSGGNL
jgi:hypothetical protein